MTQIQDKRITSLLETLEPVISSKHKLRTISWQNLAQFLVLLLVIVLVAVSSSSYITSQGQRPTKNLTTEQFSKTCLHTIQGREFVTDNNGFVCKWRDIEPITSCCRDTHLTNISHYSCDNCNETARCCRVYEFCVSCCMLPDNELVRKEVMKVESDPSIQRAYSQSIFEYCTCVCRTSSKSVVARNRYRNDEEKYCYGSTPPAILGNFTTEEQESPEDIDMMEMKEEINNSYQEAFKFGVATRDHNASAAFSFTKSIPIMLLFCTMVLTVYLVD